MNIKNINNDIILHIIEYLEIIDIVNLSLINRRFCYLCNYILKMRYKNNILLEEYYEIIKIDKKTRKEFNIKSYMFGKFPNPFKNDDYFFICKIYLNEIIYLDQINNFKYFPEKGYLEFYLGPPKNNNIYFSKIIYKNNDEKHKNHKKYNFLKFRKYIMVKNLKTFPISYMRELYIKENLDNIINNDDNNIIKRNERFSNNYFFGPPTFYEENPIDEIKLYENYDDWINIATFNPIFLNNKFTNEMLTFVIRESDLKAHNFDHTFAIYKDK